MAKSEGKRCICPYEDRCKALALAFERCDELVAVARGGYIEVPPPGMEHLIPSKMMCTPAPGGKTAKSEPTTKRTNPTTWQQIQQAYEHYFHLVEQETGGCHTSVASANGDASEPPSGHTSLACQHTTRDDNNPHHNKEGKMYVALHHFHPSITTTMKKRQQAWDKTPVWQCLFSGSLNVLLEGTQDQGMIKHMVNDSNRIKLSGMEESENYESAHSDSPSFIVLPSYPIERAEQDLQRLKIHEVEEGEEEDAPISKKEAHEAMSDDQTELSTPQGGEDTSVGHLSSDNQSSQLSSVPEARVIKEAEDLGDEERTDTKHNLAAQPEEQRPQTTTEPRIHRSSSKKSLHSLISMTKSEVYQRRDVYHETLLSFERMRRSAADERLKMLISEWRPHSETVNEVLSELSRIGALMSSTCNGIDNYTTALQSLTSSTNGMFGLEHDEPDDDIVGPLREAFSAVATDWREDFPQLQECCNAFILLKEHAERTAQKIEDQFFALQHTAVSDEVAIRQAWCELEELCIIDSETHRHRVLEDRWLRELAYRQLIVAEKTNVKTRLQPLLESVVELEKHCQTRMSEVLLAFLPRHRRLFLRTRELFDPAMDRLEMGVVVEDDLKRAVAEEAAVVKVVSEPDQAPPRSSSGFLPFFGGTPARDDPQKRNAEAQAEMTKLGALLNSVHIYEVQIVSFRVEQNTWVTSFCVVTHHQYMHFFPLLPGTDFETLRKEERPALAAACVAAWEKGSTPLLSVLLTSCSYGLSADGSFIELIITTPPRKKIGLRVGSPEECAQWVEKTQRWVMLFSMK